MADHLVRIRMLISLRELSGGHRLYRIKAKVTGVLGYTVTPEEVGVEVESVVWRRF